MFRYLDNNDTGPGYQLGNKYDCFYKHMVWAGNIVFKHDEAYLEGYYDNLWCLLIHITPATEYELFPPCNNRVHPWFWFYGSHLFRLIFVPRIRMFRHEGLKLRHNQPFADRVNLLVPNRV